ncbi:pentapeptide repeat-containing protein [Candidatus Frankia alpina]|uniref:Pentapeptide repeat-containing protein n=2 Tax=Candidatus Frankia alpina TaxID=2699483 RepID=A0A4S5C4S8_9ACTN|nr:pentapeptide repeat-containing protein [Candidatus Frankia alpina]THJ38901.1 pentapeptide repeat-containing protein [Candidatus Frankia alpina]
MLEENVDPAQLRTYVTGRLQSVRLGRVGGLMVRAWPAIKGTLCRKVDPRRKQRELVEQYTAGIGQLGSEALDVCLDGIYALESLGAESTTYRQPVVEVLSAFVRERTILDHSHGARRPWAVWSGRTTSRRSASLEPSAPADQATSDTPPDLGRNPDTDVQAALTVLGRLSDKVDISWAVPFSAWLEGVDRAGAWPCEVNLTGARLEMADLIEASLHGADLTGARLTGANLTGAQLIGADFTGARLDGANLTHVRLDGANLTGARLDGANLTGVEGLTQAQVDVARGDEKTVLPEGVTRPVSWTVDPLRSSSG